MIRHNMQKHDQRRNVARDEALRILRRVEVDGAFVDRLLQHGLQQPGIGDKDQALIHQLVSGTLAWRARIDEVLDRYVKQGIRSLTPSIRNILRLGVYQLQFLDRIPPEVAVYESVELAKRYGHKGTVGLVNAVLRKVLAEGRADASAQEPRTAEEIASAYSHPEWMVRRWIEQLGIDETIALCETNNRPWPLTLRVNALKADLARLQDALRAEEVDVAPARYASECLLVRSLPPGTRLHALASYQSGWFQVQDESSALVARLVDPQPGDSVIDLCSSPGGKTTHMAMLMANQGTILAVDLHPGRLKLVQENCGRLGITNVQNRAADGRTLHIEQLVDRVLVDAPCSGLGVLGRKQDGRWRKSEDDIARLHQLQSELLRHAATLVRPGGRLVYSTCTIEPAENEHVVEAFLRDHPHYERGAIGASVPEELISEQGYYRTWPQRHQIGGAFGAVLCRKA
jgi:16S rRNA (cytosine967-C5)-methyltransferase